MNPNLELHNWLKLRLSRSLYIDEWHRKELIALLQKLKLEL